LIPSTKLLGERVIPEEKVTEYLLNVDHPDGGGKAKFFKEHGFEVDEPNVLSSALDAHAVQNDVGEIVRSAHGTKSVVRCSLQTPDRRNPCILVVWIREEGCLSQRLVTAYPAFVS